ncbi:PPA1309 family protein [Propionibacteriaceae bacterium Y1700]|uniref:PPA1309 family protein n=1 Tax=Microlunatus sp. Y1700 TaxID=3418487 RepID=UPI003DA795B8
MDDTDRPTGPEAASIEQQDLTEPEAALVAALMELERHVGSAGWDQPTRLFALAHTVDLVKAEPALAEQLGLTADGPEGALTPIEQEHFAADVDLADALARIEWPPTVYGCAVVTERTFLPADAEIELPDDEVAAAKYVQEHPQRQDIRVVVGVDRAGHRHGLARLVSQPDEFLAGTELVPGLSEALAHTLA